MPAPFPPQFTTDDKQNIQLIIVYLYDLHRYLINGDPDEGWSTTGVVSDKTLAVGDTLTNTQHFLGTLVQTLKDKNILTV